MVSAVRNKKKPDNNSKKGFYIFIALTICLMALAAYLFLTYKPKYEPKKMEDRRKSMEIYQDYMLKEDAQRSDKEKSETSIFLQ